MSSEENKALVRQLFGIRSALLLVPLAAVAALLIGGLGTGLAAAEEHLDAPEGFGAEVLAPHATFPDDVAVQFEFRYDEPGDRQGAEVSDLPDASTVVVAEVNWEPGGTSGWHTHPGPVVVSIVEGTLEVTNADDCVTRAYEAGEAFVDPGQGNVHIATNASDTEPALAYATFFGVPDGQPGTEHVEPVHC